MFENGIFPRLPAGVVQTGPAMRHGFAELVRVNLEQMREELVGSARVEKNSVVLQVVDRSR